MRAGAIGAVLAGLLALALLTVAAPGAAVDGWRAAFLLVSCVPLGAVGLALIARVVGADWNPALAPLWPAVPWLWPLAVPMLVGQALFHHPAAGEHLSVWLSPLWFTLRTVAALALWTWLARRLVRGTVTQPGPLLLAHGIAVSVMGYDWMLGASPAQPQSAVHMVLGAAQLFAACALACALRLGTAAIRRDLAYLLVACALGLAYLLYMDFLIVWFGELPAHVGWYHDRLAMPAALLPGLALALGLVAPALLVGLGRGDGARGWAGLLGLVALGLVFDWHVAGGAGWAALGAEAATVLLAGGIAALVATAARQRVTA